MSQQCRRTWKAGVTHAPLLLCVPAQLKDPSRAWHLGRARAAQRLGGGQRRRCCSTHGAPACTARACSLGAIELALHRASHHAVAARPAAALGHPPQGLHKKRALIGAAAAGAQAGARVLPLVLVTLAPAEGRGPWALRLQQRAAGSAETRAAGLAGGLAWVRDCLGRRSANPPPWPHPRVQCSRALQPPLSAQHRRCVAGASPALPPPCACCWCCLV